MNETDDLQERVRKFSLMQLPGQPMGMHMGTSYLVHDLWLEVNRLADSLAAIERDIQALEDELRKLGAAKADTLFIASRLRAIILREAG